METTGELAPGQVSGAKDVREHPSLRGLYPTGALRGHRTALCLFAAGFYGANDAAWIAEAGIKATCVDIDTNKLREMEQHYPPNWLYVHGDVWDWAEVCPFTYDLVSVDPPTSFSMACLIFAERWTRLAKKTVILGTQRKTIHDLDHHPGVAGWSIVNVVPRNRESVWLVLRNKST